MVGEPAEIEVVGLAWEYGPAQNVEHFAEHDVSPADVHAALASEPVFFENLPGRTATHVMVGPDSRGRILYVALLRTDAPGVWKPISGWEPAGEAYLQRQEVRDDMTNYEDAAREVDELKDSGREFGGLRPVKAKIAPAPRAVVSFRVLPAELERITRSAEERGVSVSDFLRSAALAATETTDDDQLGRRIQTIEELRSKAIDLAEVARRL